MEDRIAKRLKILKEHKKLVASKIQKLEGSCKAAARKRELQKKILVGAYFLAQAQQNNTMDELNATMLGSLERASDRRLFES